MQYFFELGSNRSLSIAEIFAVLDIKGDFELVNNKILIINSDVRIDAQKLIRRLGGTIKIGEILKTNLKKIELQDLIDIIDNTPHESGKFNFGFSYYGYRRINLKPFAMEIKKFLKEKSISCRWVTGKEAILSSVIVEQNNLISSGVEIIILDSGNSITFGITHTVQPFKELSFRDYGRPARDDHSGMLPPKLAQIMINLALDSAMDKKENDFENKILLDPFCGSGTIASEAALMGIKNIIASDISPKAIADTKKNLIWFYKQMPAGIKIIQQDAKNLTKKITPASIDAIAAEPFLGPQRGHLDTKKIGAELSDLYTRVFKEFYQVLKPGGRLAFILPIFRTKQNLNIFLKPSFAGLKHTQALPASMQNKLNEFNSNRNSIIYGRAGQKVWREIIVLEK